jgi:hypothetical protein
MDTEFWWKVQKTPLGRPRGRYDNIIKKDLREIGWGGMDYIHLVQDQWWFLVNTAMNLRVPYNVWKFSNS